MVLADFAIHGLADIARGGWTRLRVQRLLPRRHRPGRGLAAQGGIGHQGGLGGLLAARAAELQPLEIATKSGVKVFSVELATTEEEKTTGLMFRKELADGRGMLFDFSPPKEVSMWMKNTF